MFQLRDVLDRELPELVEKLWREKIGDPCLCRCGGRKIFPDDPNAIKLVIEIAYAKCGMKRIREQGKQNKHRKFCKNCGSTVDRIEFTCVGYKDHNATRHAETCPGTMLLRPADISSRQWIKAHNPKSSFNAAATTYQCNSCRGAGSLIEAKEERLKKLMAERYRGTKTKFSKTIRTREARLDLLQLYHSELSPNFKASREARELGRRNYANKIDGTAAELRMLSALVQSYPEGIMEGQMRAHAGLRKSGTYYTYLSRLKKAGLIQKRSKLMYVTEAGIAYCGDHRIEAPQTTDDADEFSSREHTKANLVRRWSGKELPRRVQLGLCIVCDKIAITMGSKAPNFHWCCHQQWESTPAGRRFQSLRVQEAKASLRLVDGAPPANLHHGAAMPGDRQDAKLVTRKPGSPLTEDNLKVSYSWAIQHYLGGKSFLKIAKENHLSDHKSVKKRVKKLFARLPAPELLASRFQQLLNCFSPQC
jgi:DNA-binding PadR family transcriptional regulator